MSQLDLLLLLRWIQGGVSTCCAAYYFYTLIDPLPDIPTGGRRRFTVLMSLLLLSLGVDALVSAYIGGPALYLSMGGGPRPIVVIAIARAVNILVILVFVRSSWRVWRFSNAT